MLKGKHFANFLLSIIIVFISLLASASEPKTPLKSAAAVLNIQTKLLYIPALDILDSNNNLQTYQAVVKIKNDNNSNIPTLELVEIQPTTEQVADPHATYNTNDQTVTIPNVQIGSTNFFVEFNSVPSKSNEYKVSNLLLNVNTKQDSTQNFSSFNIATGLLHIPYFLSVDSTGKAHIYDLQLRLVDASPITFSLIEAKLLQSYPSGSLATYDSITNTVQVPNILVESVNSPKRSFQAAFNVKQNTDSIQFIISGLYSLPNVDNSFIATQSNNIIDLFWSPARNTASNISYEVHVGEERNFIPSDKTLKATLKEQTKYQLSDLTPDKTYYVLIIGVDQYGKRSLERDYVPIQSSKPQVIVTEAIYGSNPKAESEISFGKVSVGNFVSKKIEIGNLGNAPLTVNLVSVENNESNVFQIPSTVFPFTLSEKATKQLEVKCSPTQSTAYQSTLKLSSTDKSVPQITYKLTCEGFSPLTSADGKTISSPVLASKPLPEETIDFGTNELGSAKEQQIQVTNEGTSTLALDFIAIEGDSNDFKVVTKLPLSVDLTNNSKQIAVQCIPTQTGDRKAVLRLASNAAKLPEVRYNLKCSGILSTNAISSTPPTSSQPTSTGNNNSSTGGSSSTGTGGVIPPIISVPPNTQPLIPTDSQKVTPGQAKKIRYEEAEISIPVGALDNEVTLSIEALPEVIELDAGMTNVTKGTRKGYRFLPHGTKFKEKVQLRIPYDKTLIPVGQTEQDIKVYYFDEQVGRWREVKRVGIDTQTQEIISNTDHFTDFIAATLTAPDSPEAASYNKNQMKDIKAADPSSQINLIDPPKATNMGDANLHYPIQLPAGRVGMHPELALQYSSGSGNGWMGLGWDLSAPSISIDTRWGVPRYSSTHETETYLLGGQLTPIVHRSDLQPRTAEKIFRSRIEGSFQKIIRHGDNPKNYWWEVTGKDGKVFYYGGNPSTGVFADAVLTDYQGNVFQWFLHEVRDVHGNNIQYQYVRVDDVGLMAGTVLGYNLYLKAIYYTGYNKETGPYQVNFIRDRDLKEARRIDVSIDARGAFKKVTADLLRKIEISYQKDKIRSYEFKYKQGAFQKTLLDSISQYGAKGTLFNTHTFDYYDEIRDANKNYQGFASASSWATGNDNVSIGLFGKGNASALGGNKSLATDIHLYLGLAMGGCTKDKSIGGKIGGQFGESEGKLILVDINGDGLEDKVYKKGSTVYYRPNRSGPNGTSQFGEERVVANLGALSEDKNRMFSGGGELYFIGNIGFNVGRSYSESNVYITEVNSDKLPDLVAYGQVLFNSINANGDPVFNPNSMNTPYPIGQSAIDANKILGNLNELREQQIDAFPLLDSVRRWTAPYDGTIQITGNVALRQDNSSERNRYMTADGVRVAIQLNQAELWATTISPTDYASKQPTNVENIVVKQGDILYFRVQSIFDGAYDQVNWQPDIQYLNTTSLLDANLLDAYHYNAKEDFSLASYRGVRLPMPIKGTISLTGIFEKTDITSDNVTLQFFKNNEILIDKHLSWDQTSTIEINQEIQVAEQDSLYARVKIDSPVDLRNLTWKKALNIVYKQTDKPDVILVDEQGNPTIKFELWPDFDVYPVSSLYPITNLKEPLQALQIPSTGTYKVSPLFAMSPNDTEVNGEFIITVKKAGQLGLLAKQIIPVIKGIVGNAEFAFQANQGDKIYVEVSTRDFNLVEKLTQKQIGIQGQEIPIAFYEPSASSILPRNYRGWTALAYNGNRERANQPISITQKDLDGTAISEAMTDLQTKTQQLSTDSEPSFENTTQKIVVFPLYPHWDMNAWREASGDANFWINGQTLSSSRQGPDYISVPTPEQLAGASAVPRISTTDNLGFMAGVSAISASFSRSNSKGILDFLDMNGDGFPDIVGNGHVQFSPMVGGLSNLVLPILGGDVRGSKANSFNVGASGTFPKSNSRSSGKSGSTSNINANLGGNFTKGDSETKYDLMDINGDGIVDKVSVQSGQLWVQLGFGYGFTPAEFWGNANLNKSENMGLGLGGGFNDGFYGFAGSINLGGNKTDTKASLLDINGDGLLDRVTSANGGLIVGLNTGNGFGADIFWPNALGDVSNNMDITLGGGVYVTIPIPLLPTPLCIIINPGGDLTQTMSRPETSIRDIDGDGYPDYLQSTSDSNINAALNPIGRTNLLKTVHRPLRASFSIEYQRNGNTYADPHSRWNMSRVSIYDGHVGDGVDITSTTYQYKDGFYHRQERDFYGYKTVVEAVRDTQDAIYRTVTSEYLNDSFYSKGLLHKQTTADALGNKYHETENTYVFRNVETQGELANKNDLVATVFPELRRVDTRFYEGQATAGKMTYEYHEYNATGDIIKFIDGGDVGTDDDVEAIVEYYINQSKHIFKPQTITVLANGKVMRKRSGDFDSNGDLTQLRQYLEDGSSATTDLEYDRYGNIARKTRPANHRGQRYSLEYTFDSSIFTYNTQVKDSFGYISSGEHDLLCGAVKKTVDLNKQPITHTFDEFCRTETITGPYQAGTRDVTLRFDYHPDAETPWALTQHYDAYHPTDPVETVVLIDGLKRAIQTKKDNTIHTGETGNPKDMMTVTGHQEFDFLGRAIKQWYPITENLGKQGVFNPQIDSIPPTITTYDVIDRTLTITAPDNTVTRTDYGFGNDRKGQLQFLTRVTDANGIVKETYKDVNENITSVKEFNNKGTQTIWTSYDYDPLNQIIKVTDDKNNQTTVGYDNLGRRLWINSPDAGKTETVYDLASNPIKKVTANLKSQGKSIDYVYDFTHLIEIHYPTFSGNNVTYTYGSAGAPYNRAGRIVTVSDQSGTEERFYGVLGETVKTIKTVSSSTQGNSTNSPEIYTTEYVYDTWNRLHKLTYPDGEILTNEYDSGGLVNKIFGDKAGWHYDYVNRLEYDKFEQRAFVEMGNKIRSSYAYNPYTRRLANLRAGNSMGNGALFQDLTYTYDKVGNILGQANAAKVTSASQMGGATNYVYEYDDLYRLTAARGTFDTMPNKQHVFRLNMEYDTIHNILHKNQYHELIQPSTTPVIQKKETYDWRYAYQGAQPHAPTHIYDATAGTDGKVGGRTFGFDGNGNQQGWTDDLNGTRRNIVWDDENRIQSIFDNGHEKTYKYNDAGERVIKQGPQGETVYVNPYFSIRNREVGTKHIMAGSTRMVSKMMKQDKPNSNPNGKVPEEKDLYFYHPDHLGSSAYITDAKGGIYQHLEYLPFGETFVEEVSSTQRTPYWFTAKELDEETGLYYFGARYYDVRTSVWNAVDPILGQYLPTGDTEKDKNLPGMGGVFNSFNMGLYTYSHTNPIKYVDPDGNVVVMFFSLSKGTITAVDIGKTKGVPTSFDVFKAKLMLINNSIPFVPDSPTVKVYNVFSGNSGFENNPDNQHMVDTGPLPLGEYLVGNSYIPDEHVQDAANGGNYNWYKLYGKDGKGGFSYDSIPVKDPKTKRTVYRGGFNLHTGNRSNGCVTIRSNIGENEPKYPQSKQYNNLQKMLNATSEYTYNNSGYKGVIVVEP